MQCFAASPYSDLQRNIAALEGKQRLSGAVLLSGREKFSPYYGGALARWTYEVYSRLRQEIDVTVFGFPTDSEDVYPLSHQSSEAWRACQFVSRIPVARRYEDQLWLRALMPRLRRFDFLHIHNRPQWVASLRQMDYEGAILLHLQNDHLGHWAPHMLNELALRVDRVVVCSNFLRDCFAPKSSALTAKTEVVFNGVNRELFFPREEIREPKTIFFVGRLDAEKGVIQLMQAYARVLQAHPDASLVIGGATGFGIHQETAYVRQVRELANSVVRSCKGKIQFTGYIHHDRDLPSWFQRATIFASPSLFQEPFGLVNAEAMACATPVVGANRGGIPELLGGTGRLIDPENTEDFATTLSNLLASPADCKQLGAAAYQRYRRMFDWRLIADGWAALLRQAVRPGNQFVPVGT
ncbi:MAG TPA: glycosyltransferase family 4 protein [Terriglobales bacterium]|nr:glycosyltransferase family 4 protein [Terriglobales bacterium]